MNPSVAHLKAFPAAFATRSNFANFFNVRAGRRHEIFPVADCTPGRELRKWRDACVVLARIPANTRAYDDIYFLR